MLPLATEIDTVLSIWLEEVPKFTNIFVRLMLVICMIDSVSNPFMIASAATGKVKVYQSVVGGILITIVPIAYLVLELGGNPYSVFFVHIAVGMVAFTVRLLIVRRLVSLSVRKYIKNVLLPCTLVLLPAVVFVVVLKLFMPGGILYAFINIVLIVIVTSILSFLLGLTKHERTFIWNKISKGRMSK